VLRADLEKVLGAVRVVPDGEPAGPARKQQRRRRLGATPSPGRGQLPLERGNPPCARVQPVLWVGELMGRSAGRSVGWLGITALQLDELSHLGHLRVLRNPPPPHPRPAAQTTARRRSDRACHRACGAP
jgi:hypothetical protein